ncbi:SMP-30/Gluconolaconase/LRE domain protein [Sulfitobacter noctilucae]|uniref:SMP-30/gluconolactonase/LRE family protein n=1 Tax=Sulfitobacter noctilucae TaxID=1342302 RepID=UPI00046AE874|nr:SMP-30/gluconolactonase/LRE family protein [Sulfitobacter noctilucae]KIN60689.1 SMP-30/Gluconolaconase/LRE domain protein [Sulfitobacter noctilucae]
MTPFDTRLCSLGEGPLWHPDRQTLYWFDILGQRMLAQGEDGQTQEWQFDESFSAAGIIDAERLFLTSETAFWTFDIGNGERERLCAFDAENPLTRSNDGRADPWGGFWVGTMGKETEPGIAAIYRYYKGELRQLVEGVTVSNTISFAPDQNCAYYTDTPTHRIMRQPLTAADGWPEGPAEVFVDLTEARLYPDGAVTDAAGNLWVAMWGGYCVVCFDPTGREVDRIAVPARQPSCPAFGGPDLRDLYVTSATTGVREEELTKRPMNGATFVQRDVAQGRPEPRVTL